MTNKLPWFPMYAGDWFLSTAEMSNAEKGAYIDLLCMQWDNGSILKVPARYLTEWDTLKHKFVEDGGGGFVNIRLNDIRQSKDKALEKQRLGGLQSAKLRGKQPTKVPTKQPGAIQSQSQKIKKKSAATEVPAPYIDLARAFLSNQREFHPKESAWKDFEKRVAEGAKNLHLFHTQNGWTQREISDLLHWVLVDDFWSTQIRTLGGIRSRKKGEAMKFENAKAASGDVKDDVGARNEAEAIEQHERLKREDAEATPIGEFKEMVQDVAQSLRG